MTEDEELLEFQHKLWDLIRETSPPDESKILPLLRRILNKKGD